MFFQKKKLTKRASVYISDKHKQIIITPRLVNKDGINYEQEDCYTTSIEISNLELGVELIKSLNLFTFQNIELKDNKLTDWPSFKHSKSKSVKAFEQEYIFISVDCVNEHNLFIQFEGHPFKGSEITINSSFSFYADKEIIGERMLKVYNICLTKKILTLRQK